MRGAKARRISTPSVFGAPNRKAAHGIVTTVEPVVIGVNGIARHATAAPTGSLYRVKHAKAIARYMTMFGSQS